MADTSTSRLDFMEWMNIGPDPEIPSDPPFLDDYESIVDNSSEPTMDTEAQLPRQGDLSWKLSAHPITLLWFLGFRISSLLVYLFGGLFVSDNFILIFILTIVLLSMDFYYLKNIAGRRLVGLRWWNEVDPATGDSKWVYESADTSIRPGGTNKTDSRFFWLALYVQPALWIGLAILAVVRLSFVWLSVIVVALILTITNTLAFSRADKFSQASNIATRALDTGGLARSLAGNMFGRVFNR